jgi:short-subunit dehydrogenase
MPLEGKLVVVTGGSSGIGKHLAADFLRRGARTILVSRDQARLQQAARELAEIGPRVDVVTCDVGDVDSVGQMGAEVLSRFGCPDILINNAGFASYRTFEQMELREIEALVSVNFLGALRCTKVFLGAMVSRRTGAVVNIASIAGRIPMTPNGTYSASKHGLVAWSETLRYEVSQFGLSVSVICPGRVKTNFFDHPTFRERRTRREMRQNVPLEKVSQATFDAIAHRRFLTYVPTSLGLLVWAANTMPVVVKPLYRRLMQRRVKDLYARSSR